MGTWPIYKKTLPTTDLNKKKNFHLIKYLIATFIFFLSFQSVLVSVVTGFFSWDKSLLENQPWSLLNSALRGWVVTSGSPTRNFEASWCGSANGRDVIWRRAVSDWAGVLVRAVTCSCDKLVKRSWTCGWYSLWPSWKDNSWWAILTVGNRTKLPSSRWRRRGRSLREVFAYSRHFATTDLSQIYNRESRRHGTPCTKTTDSYLFSFLYNSPRKIRRETTVGKFVPNDGRR